MKIAPLLTALLAWIIHVSGDIAPNPVFSETLRPFRPTPVRMVDERVTVDLYKDHALVHVAFTMKNQGAETTLEVGFPNIPEWRDKPFLTNFTASVDGKLQSVEAHSIPEINEGQSPFSPGKYMDWYVWEMTFQSNETKTVEVSYKQPYGRFYTSGLLWKRYFSYILETGAGWAGTIGKADIVVNLKDLTSEHILEAHPPGYVMTSNQISWALADLEPTEGDNVRIVYNAHKDVAAFATYQQESETEKDWNDEWIIAFAWNMAGDYEAAVRHAERGIQLKLPKKQAYVSDIKLPIYAQLALLKQLAMARYHLYHCNQQSDELERLQETLNELQTLTAQVIQTRESTDQIFSTEYMEDPANDWLFREFLMSADWIGHYQSLFTFAGKWDDHIEAQAGRIRKGDFELDGIFWNQNECFVEIEGEVYRAGDQFKGFTIEEISKTFITYSKSDGSAVLLHLND